MCYHIYIKSSGLYGYRRLVTSECNFIPFNVDVDTLIADLASMAITGLSRFTFIFSKISAVAFCATSFLTSYKPSHKKDILNPSNFKIFIQYIFKLYSYCITCIQVS